MEVFVKIIHTADWHLGNRMHDIDRSEEVMEFLKWLKKQIINQNARALIIAGDIFDTANPPTDARTFYHDFLASLLGTCCKNVIIIGGNHDSGALLDSEKQILQRLNIHVIGSIANIEVKDLVFELYDDCKNPCAVCAAVPFVREGELRHFFDDNKMDGTFSDQAYGILYKKVYEEAEKIRAGRSIPLIATGHLYASDLEGRLEGISGEIVCDDGRKKLDVVGKLGSVHAGIFPEQFDYVALGHVHYSTMVAKNEKIRYSGSPFVMGFEEASIPRNILCADVEKQKLSVQKIKIPQVFEYRRLNGDYATIRSLLENYRQKTDRTKTFLELYYKREEGINIYDQLEDLLSELEEKNVYVVSRRVQETGLSGEFLSNEYDMDELSSLAPEKIFENLILSKVKIETAGKTSEEIQTEQKKILEVYMPLFMESFGEFENSTGEGKL